MFLFLNAFNPDIERNPNEWDVTPKISKKMDFFIRLMKLKGK